MSQNNKHNHWTMKYRSLTYIYFMRSTFMSQWSIIEVCYSSINWAASSEFVSSSIPSWQTLTAHAQPFRGTRELAFCLKVSLDSLLVWASSEGSGETARMRRLAWTFAARIGDKYQIRLTRSKYSYRYMAKPLDHKRRPLTHMYLMRSILVSNWSIIQSITLLHQTFIQKFSKIMHHEI